MNEYLILVNKYNLLSEDIIGKIEKIVGDTNEGGIRYDGEIHKSERLSNEVNQQFTLLQKKLNENGYNFFVESGFRDYNCQVNLWISRMIGASIDKYGHPLIKPVNKYIVKLIDHLCTDDYLSWYKEDPIKRIKGILSIIGRSDNYDFDSIKKRVEEIVALPGSSEHHLGMAFDIGLLDNNERNCDLREEKYSSAATVFMETAPDYGFILRFPEGKNLFTGFNEEIWHYRYVGSPEVAHEIMDNGLTLEEYHIANYIMSSEYLSEQFLSDNLKLDFLIQFIGEESTNIIKQNPSLLDGIKNYINLKNVGSKTI